MQGMTTLKRNSATGVVQYILLGLRCPQKTVTRRERTQYGEQMTSHVEKWQEDDGTR